MKKKYGFLFGSAVLILAAVFTFTFTACKEALDALNNATNKVATPSANPPAGEVASSAAIALTTSTAGATIYYTTNGDTPTTSSIPYSDSSKPTITTSPTTIKAIAVKDGMNNSEILTATYTLSATWNNITLSVLNYLDLTASNKADSIAKIWDKYTSAHPNTTIIREDLYQDAFHNKTEAYAAAGQIPDVVYAWPSGRSTTLYAKKLLKDLTPLINKDGLNQKYLPLALDPSQFAGNYVGILTQSLTSSHAFYVNNEVLQACGLTPAKTYDDLKAQVPVLKAKGYETILMANQDQDTWVMQSCLFSMLAGRFGGEGWDQRILQGSARFTDADFVNALKFVKQLYDDGVISQSTFTTDYGSVVGLFANNKGAYLVDGDWRVGDFLTTPSTWQDAIEITVFPDIAGAKLNNSTSGVLGTGWGMSAAIPAGSEKEAAAWDLVKWLAGEEVQKYQVSIGGLATPSWNGLDVSSLSLGPMQKAITALSTQYTTSTAVIDGVFADSVFTPLNNGLQAIGKGTQTPEQVAQAVQNAFDAWKASN
jgi:raffinose/stachyose/melibiose transport system substrate-binding protein